MYNEINLTKMFKKRVVCFSWRDHFAQIILSIQIPELSGNRYSVSGDWGPNYTVNVDPNHLIKLDLKHGKNTQSYALELASVAFKSPMLKSERDIHPLFIELLDEQRSLFYQIFLNHEGEAEKVKVLEREQSPEKDVIILEN